MWQAIGAILPGLIKLGLELWYGKKMSEEDFQKWIAADKETRRNISVARDKYKAEKKRLKEEKKKYLEYLVSTEESRDQ
ncbi:MAG: hypothetical protein GY699_09530 [Desulfobacteraceae bacterium]|nr:hypothetical protein [Desulfobacteraceae bacterium]